MFDIIDMQNILEEFFMNRNCILKKYQFLQFTLPQIPPLNDGLDVNPSFYLPWAADSNRSALRNPDDHENMGHVLLERG